MNDMEKFQAALGDLQNAILGGDKGRIEMARLDCHELLENMIQDVVKQGRELRRQLGLKP
jgi:hypothetical protein